MPLSAIINDKEVISCFLNEEEWNELKINIKKYEWDVIISQTKRKGYLRTSKLGLNHFVHARGQSPEGWKTESPQHLLAKSEILLGCKDAGWDAHAEYIEDDWIADVLAVQGNKRIAFEVQWSTQSAWDTAYRQDRYQESKVRGCWFFKSPPKEFVVWENELVGVEGLPLFKIFENKDKKIEVAYNDVCIPLRKFTQYLLTRKVKHCKEYSISTKQVVTMSIFETSCWKCKYSQYVFQFASDFCFRSFCGKELMRISENWDNEKLLFRQDIVERVKKEIESNSSLNLTLASIKRRFSQTIHDSYMSFGCIKCDSLMGDWYLNKELFELNTKGMTYDFNFEVELPKGSQTEDGEHWCFNEGKRHCC